MKTIASESGYRLFKMIDACKSVRYSFDKGDLSQFSRFFLSIMMQLLAHRAIAVTHFKISHRELNYFTHVLATLTSTHASRIIELTSEH